MHSKICPLILQATSEKVYQFRPNFKAVNFISQRLLFSGRRVDPYVFPALRTDGQDRAFRFSDDLRSNVGQMGRQLGRPIDAKDYQIGAVKSACIRIARVTLTNEGRCKLKLLEDGLELEQWQFRKIALHDLFFGADDDE